MHNIHLVNGYNVLFIGKDKEYDTTIVSYMYVKKWIIYKLQFIFVYRDSYIYKFSKKSITKCCFVWLKW